MPSVRFSSVMDVPKIGLLYTIPTVSDRPHRGVDGRIRKRTLFPGPIPVRPTERAENLAWHTDCLYLWRTGPSTMAVSKNPLFREESISVATMIVQDGNNASILYTLTQQ